MESISLCHFLLEPISFFQSDHMDAYRNLLTDQTISQMMFDVEYFIGGFSYVLEKGASSDDYFIRYQGTIIGYIKISFFPLCLEISYALFKDYRGKGFMSQVLIELYDYLKVVISRRYQMKALIHCENQASIITVTKAGFECLNRSQNSKFNTYVRKLNM